MVYSPGHKLVIAKYSPKAVLVLLLLAVLAMTSGVARTQPKPFLVFAAVSMKDALEAIAVDFEEETGQKVTFSFAATSSLARQIAAGAPADLFISADLDWAAWLQVQNLTTPETQRIIARNRLALVAPVDSSFDGKGTINEALLQWRDGGGGKMALADPDHVPVGRYARSALKHIEKFIGAYETLAPRFVITGNVRLAVLLVARKEVPLGIVYHSDSVVEPRIKLVGVFSEESHPDIVYPALRTLEGQVEADAFLDYLGSEAAQRHFKNAGLLPPPEGS